MDNRAPACQRANSNRSGWPALAGLLTATSWHSTCPLGWGLLMGDRGATLCRARSQDSWPSARRVTEREKPRDHFHGIAAETKAASSEVRYPDKHHSSGPSIQTPWPHQTASLVMPLSSAQAGSSQRKTEWPKSFTKLSQEGMRNSNQPRKGRAFLDSFSSPVKQLRSSVKSLTDSIPKSQSPSQTALSSQSADATPLQPSWPADSTPPLRWGGLLGAGRLPTRNRATSVPSSSHLRHQAYLFSFQN